MSEKIPHIEVISYITEQIVNTLNRNKSILTTYREPTIIYVPLTRYTNVICTLGFIPGEDVSNPLNLKSRDICMYITRSYTSDVKDVSSELWCGVSLQVLDDILDEGYDVKRKEIYRMVDTMYHQSVNGLDDAKVNVLCIGDIVNYKLLRFDITSAINTFNVHQLPDDMVVLHKLSEKRPAYMSKGMSNIDLVYINQGPNGGFLTECNIVIEQLHRNGSLAMTYGDDWAFKNPVRNYIMSYSEEVSL